MKERISTVDYIDKTSYDNKILTNSNITPPDSSKFNISTSEEQKKNYDGHAIFTIDNVRFGLEICLDHIRTRLDKSILNSDKLLDIQLVPSCGVNAKDITISNTLNTNGLVFLVDGNPYNSNAVFTKSRTAIKPLSTKNFSPLKTSNSTNEVFSGEGTVSVYPTQKLTKSKERTI